MERYVFTDKYLLTVYYFYDEEFDCFSCANKNEVFQILTDKIKDGFAYLQDMEPEYIAELREDKEDSTFLDYITSTECITNPEIIATWFSDYLNDDSIRYRVTDNTGKVWFSYRC